MRIYFVYAHVHTSYCTMPISEERLHLLLPRRLKQAVSQQAMRLDVSVGEYIRRLITADLDGGETRPASIAFPFGKNPIRSGRTMGSVDHDRPE